MRLTIFVARQILNEIDFSHISQKQLKRAKNYIGQKLGHFKNLHKNDLLLLSYLACFVEENKRDGVGNIQFFHCLKIFF